MKLGLRTLVPIVLAICSLAAFAAVGIDHPKPTNAGLSRAWMRKGGDVNLPDVASRRSRLVAAYCGQCHAPPPPELHSSDEWRWLIVRMDMRAWAANRSSVRVASNEELAEIAKYYDAYSGD